MQVNVEDYVLLPVFVMAVAISLGLLDAVYFGIDFGATLIDLGAGHVFSIAHVAALASLGYVAYSNDWSSAELTGIQLWIVIATVGLIISPPFVPILQETLASDPVNMIAAAVQIGGYVVFSFVG